MNAASYNSRALHRRVATPRTTYLHYPTSPKRLNRALHKNISVHLSHYTLLLKSFTLKAIISIVTLVYSHVYQNIYALPRYNKTHFETILYTY